MECGCLVKPARLTDGQSAWLCLVGEIYKTGAAQNYLHLWCRPARWYTSGYRIDLWPDTKQLLDEAAPSSEGRWRL